MILSERIKTVVKHSGLSIPKFAKNVGFITPQTVRELINGRTKSLSYTVANKILATYPEINESWLKTGEGEMLNPHPDVIISDSSNLSGGDNAQILIKTGRSLYEEPRREDNVMISTLKKEVDRLKDLLSESARRVQRLENEVDKRNTQIDRLLSLLEQNQ